MPLILIKGIFKPATGIPDGDTVRFAPFDPTPLFALPRRRRAPRLNRNNGTISLRYEGIDALEKDAKEPFASEATQNNLKLLGLSGPNDEEEGYILASQIGPKGRPICFVFPGKTNEEDGSKVFLDKEMLKGSVNFKLLVSGLVYPLFYDTLFSDLRTSLALAASTARKKKLGIWPHDKTGDGVVWEGASSLPNLPPIFPKLWRRLEKYTQDRDFRDDSDTLDEFRDYLETKKDRLFILSESKFTDLDNIVEIHKNKVSIPFLPEDLIFNS